MKKHLLKTLLVATGLLTGTSPILADGVITTLPVTEDFENGTGIFSGGEKYTDSKVGNVLLIQNATATANFDTDAEKEGNQPYTLKSNEKITIKYTAFQGWESSAQVSNVALKNSEGKDLLSYEYTPKKCNITNIAIGGTTVSGFAEFLCQNNCNDAQKRNNANGFGGSSQYYTNEDARNTQVTITISGDGLVSINFTIAKTKINKTFSAKLDENFTKDIASFVISNANTTTKARAYGIDNLSISSEVTADVSAKYTIKKVCGDVSLGETSATGIIGKTPSISTDNLFYDEKKYIYVSNDVESVGAIAETGTVYTITYREATDYNYSINYLVGNKIQKHEGHAFEGETVTAGYPYYLLSDGTLYKSNKSYSSDGKGFQLSLTLSEDNMSKDITFKETDLKNIVYFSEAEDIDGLTKATNGNTATRSSNGGSAYAKDGNVEFTKLPAGVYKISAGVCDASSTKPNSTWNFFAGEKNVFPFNVTTINWQEGTSDEFTLAQETPIYLGQGGNANKAVDFIYIQKVADVEVSSITDAQYATYVTSSAVVVPENVKVYTVKANATGIETTEVAAGTVIPANTAVLLNAEEAGDYAFTVSAEEGTTLENNDLKASTGAAATGVEYCLTQQDGKVGFAKVKEGVEIPAGKAYLVVNGQAASNFFALGGNETAIKNIETEKTTDNAYYTLQGVKVVNPAKGVYIHNGKKVVIK